MNQPEDSSLTFKGCLADNGTHPLNHLFFLSCRHTSLSLNNKIHCRRKKLLLLQRGQEKKWQRNKTGGWGCKVECREEYVE